MCVCVPAFDWHKCQHFHCVVAESGVREAQGSNGNGKPHQRPPDRGPCESLYSVWELKTSTTHSQHIQRGPEVQPCRIEMRVKVVTSKKVAT